MNAVSFAIVSSIAAIISSSFFFILSLEYLPLQGVKLVLAELIAGGTFHPPTGRKLALPLIIGG